jgi:protein SCO1/2
VPSPTLSVPPPQRTRSDTRRGAFVATALIAAALGVAVWWSRAGRSAPLPVLDAVPHVTLVERSGQPFTTESLGGHVWIADFVFTRCPDFCPALTTRMAGLQKRLAHGDDPIRLVSFSVDPTHDTPDVLAEYATHVGAGDGWLFVTGPRAPIADLLRNGFKVAWADDGPPSAPITHSDRFVLVDRALRIRGYYHGTDAADVDRLAHDAVALRDATER